MRVGRWWSIVEGGPHVRGVVAALSMHGHAFVPLLEDDWGQADRDRLQGRWRVIRFEQYGRECKATTRNFQGLEYIIDGNKFSFWDIEAQQFRWQGTFTIDPLKKQKQIGVKRKDGWCTFLERKNKVGVCTIYNNRPSICKEWPSKPMCDLRDNVVFRLSQSIPPKVKLLLEQAPKKDDPLPKEDPKFPM